MTLTHAILAAALGGTSLVAGSSALAQVRLQATAPAPTPTRLDPFSLNVVPTAATPVGDGVTVVDGRTANLGGRPTRPPSIPTRSPTRVPVIINVPPLS